MKINRPKLLKTILRQHTIDGGQLGGLINVFSASLVILSPFSFLGILALNYDRYIKYWIDLNTFITISAFCFVAYEWLFFTLVYPSMVQFGNKQACTFENPLLNEIKELKASIKEIKEKLEKEDNNDTIL